MLTYADDVYFFSFFVIFYLWYLLVKKLYVNFKYYIFLHKKTSNFATFFDFFGFNISQAVFDFFILMSVHECKFREKTTFIFRRTYNKKCEKNVFKKKPISRRLGGVEQKQTLPFIGRFYICRAMDLEKLRMLICGRKRK